MTKPESSVSYPCEDCTTPEVCRQDADCASEAKHEWDRVRVDLDADDFEVVRVGVRFAPQPELDRALIALERIEANQRTGRIIHGDA